MSWWDQYVEDEEENDLRESKKIKEIKAKKSFKRVAKDLNGNHKRGHYNQPRQDEGIFLTETE